MGCLYILESPSGKRYIGISSKSMEARWAKHVEHALGKRDNGALYAALRKYGHESFTKKVLAIADFEYLKELEVRAIASFGTYYPNGYNLTLGGEGTTGKRTNEQLVKHSDSQKRRFASQEERDKVRERFAKWREENPEAYARSREKIRLAMAAKRKPIDPRSHSERTRDAMRRPEVAEKVKAAAKARAADPSWRKKVSESKMGQGLGAKRSKEHIEAQVAGIRAAWADPVKRAARIEKNRLARLKR